MLPLPRLDLDSLEQSGLHPLPAAPSCFTSYSHPCSFRSSLYDLLSSISSRVEAPLSLRRLGQPALSLLFLLQTHRSLLPLPALSPSSPADALQHPLLCLLIDNWANFWCCHGRRRPHPSDQSPIRKGKKGKRRGKKEKRRRKKVRGHRVRHRRRKNWNRVVTCR